MELEFELQQAKAEAEAVAIRLSSTDADVLMLTSADRAAYLRARQLLDPVGGLAGVSFVCGDGCAAGCWADAPLATTTTIAMLTASINGKRRM